jgi:hypothetical protein
MTARRVLSLLAAAVCATALVGCGGDTLSFDPVANAANKTSGTASARVQFTATVTMEGVGGMAFSGSGIFDGKTRSGALNMRFALPADAQAQLGVRDPTMQMIMDGRNGLVVYMRSPMFRVFSNKWLKLDMTKLGKKEGVDFSQLMGANQADPSESLRMLMASTDSHPIGYDRVRGVFTTHYKFNIDLARLTKDNEATRKMYEMLRKMTGVSSFPAEAWIDDQGHVRRLKFDMSFNAPTGAAFSMTMTEELYAFGVKVNIRPPSASEVIDGSRFLGG